MKGTCEERFWAKTMPCPNTGHWLWIGATLRNGYGHFWNGARLVMAHRWAYEHFVGQIPTGLHLDHLCRVRHCVCPDHLEPVTNAENMRRGIQVTTAAARTHCDNGHSLDDALVWIRDTGRTRRVCRVCHNARTAAWRADNKEHSRRYFANRRILRNQGKST